MNDAIRQLRVAGRISGLGRWERCRRCCRSDLFIGFCFCCRLVTVRDHGVSQKECRSQTEKDDTQNSACAGRRGSCNLRVIAEVEMRGIMVRHNLSVWLFVLQIHSKYVMNSAIKTHMQRLLYNALKNNNKFASAYCNTAQ